MAAVGRAIPGQIQRSHGGTHAGVLVVADGHFEHMGVGLIEGLGQHLTNILLAQLVAQAVRARLKGLDDGAAGNFARGIATHTIRHSEEMGLAH